MSVAFYFFTLCVRI